MRSNGLPKASRFLHTQKTSPLWEAAELSVIYLLRRHGAENKIVSERAKTECCEASFYWKKCSLNAVNISLRKSRFLKFSRLCAEKGSSTECQGI